MASRHYSLEIDLDGHLLLLLSIVTEGAVYHAVSLEC